MGDGNAPPGTMVHRQNCEVLQQRPAAPDIQGLRSKTDAQQRLVQIVRILQQQLVHRLAGRVSGRTLGNRLLPILLGIHICTASWQQNSLAGVDQVCDLARRQVERYLDRLPASLFNRCRVGWP